MVYLPFNLWAKSYVTTLDKTVVQFHLFPSFAPIKTKNHPLFNVSYGQEPKLKDNLKARERKGPCFDDGLYVCQVIGGKKSTVKPVLSGHPRGMAK